LVECYAVEINQVFMNVLTNAIDALEDAFINKNLSSHCGCEEEPAKSGQIRIVTEVCPGEKAVAVRIKDNGWGMEETVRKKIFEPFFSTKPVGKGAGIGLAISEEIVVEKHGGKLICISAPGEGTELIIEIPLGQIHRKPIVK
jgi:chemotaxis family two-component system sensor kinase Cph1